MRNVNIDNVKKCKLEEGCFILTMRNVNLEHYPKKQAYQLGFILTMRNVNNFNSK